MAKIIFSPLISSASGKTADAVFARWKGINYVRQRVIPANPKSDAQMAQREALARVLLCWRTFEQQIKDQLDEYAVNYAMSGYNWFMGHNVVLEKTSTLGIITPTHAEIAGPTSLALSSPVAQQIKLDWTGGPAGAEYDLYVLTRQILPAVVNSLVLLDSDTTQFDALTFTSGADFTSAATYQVMMCAERIADNQFSFSATDSVVVT